MKKTVFSLRPDPNSYYDRATEYFYDGNFLHALREVNEAIRLDSECLEYRFLQADIYYDMGLYSQSLVSVLRVLAFDTTVQECHGLAARALCAMGRTAAAMFYFNLGLRYGLADGAVSVDELKQALTSSDGFLLVDDEEQNATALDTAREAYASQDYERAFSLAGEVDPSSQYAVASILLQADSAIARRDYEAAVCVLSVAAERDDAIRAALSHVYFQMGASDEAIAAYPDPCACDVQNAEQAIRVAQVLVDRGAFADAIRYFQKTLEYIPYDLDAMGAIAMCESQLGHGEESSRWLLNLLTIDPLDFVAMKQRERVLDGGVIPTDRYLDLEDADVEQVRKTLAGWLSKTDRELEEISRHSYYTAMLFYALDHELVDEEDWAVLLDHLLSCERFELALREMLVDYAMGLAGKRIICTALASYGSDYLEVEHEDVIWYVDLKRPSRLKPEDGFLLRAWALATATLSYASVDFGKELRFAFNKLSDLTFPEGVTPEIVASAVISVLLVHRRIELRSYTVIPHLFDGICGDLDAVELLSTVLDQVIMGKRRKSEGDRGAQRKNKGEQNEI